MATVAPLSTRAQWLQLGRVLAEPRVVYFGLGAMMAATWWALEAPTEARFRITGGLLQILGIVLVALQLLDAARRFEQPTVGQATMCWLLRLRNALGPIRTVDAVAIASGTGTLEAVGLATTTKRGQPTLEDRISDVERGLGEVRETISANHSVSNERLDRHERLIQENATQSENDQRQLAERLRGYAVGSLQMAYVGAVVTFVGYLVSTFGPELSNILKH